MRQIGQNIGVFYFMCQVGGEPHQPRVGCQIVSFYNLVYMQCEFFCVVIIQYFKKFIFNSLNNTFNLGGLMQSVFD